MESYSLAVDPGVPPVRDGPPERSKWGSGSANDAGQNGNVRKSTTYVVTEVRITGIMLNQRPGLSIARVRGRRVAWVSNPVSYAPPP